MRTTTSKDGTTLAYDVAGRGPALVFVPGVFNLRDTCAPVAAELLDAFTCFTYDRRARGDSSDTPPYALEREVEDLRALIDVAGGSAAVFGFSSGAVLALRAAADGLGIDRLFLYEPPFRFEDGTAAPADLPERLPRLVDEGRSADVVSTFQLEGVGLPPDVVEGMRHAPFFPALQAMAQSVVHDATMTRDLAAAGHRGPAARRPAAERDAAGPAGRRRPRTGTGLDGGRPAQDPDLTSRRGLPSGAGTRAPGSSRPVRRLRGTSMSQEPPTGTDGDHDGPWTVIDWSAPRPDEAALDRARSSVSFVPVPEDREPVLAYVAALAGLMRHGGALSARFRIEGGGATARWYLSRSRFDEFRFLRLLLGSSALVEALPELGGVAFAQAPDERFRRLDPVLLDGTLAAALCRGGAYEDCRGRSALAKDLGVAVSGAVVGRRFDDVRLHAGEPPWFSPWFRGVAWDGTWVVTDLRHREVLVVCATDAD